MSTKYCAAPWRGLHINFRGDVKTCCAGDPNMLGDLNHQPISKIVFGDALREIRRVIKSGELHPQYCHNCIEAERYGRSERHWHNDVNQDFDVTAADLDEFDPTIIDVRWNTTCNLSCNYCGDYCSSKWASIKKGIPVRNGIRTYYQDVCDWLAAHATDIREVAMVGGEPLLLPENERLLDVIPQNCIVTLITNTSVDLDRNRIFAKLSQRQRVGWSMSFDNIGERFEYVRHGGTWDLLNHNVDRIQSLMANNGHWGGVHAVYNLYNCTRLVEFREWIQQRGLTVVWQTLFQPNYLDVMKHDQRLRAMALAEAQLLIDRCGSYMQAAEHEFFQGVIRSLSSETPSAADARQKFIRHINDIETLYHGDQAGKFKQLWPEIYFLLENHEHTT